MKREKDTKSDTSVAQKFDSEGRVWKSPCKSVYVDVSTGVYKNAWVPVGPTFC